MDASLASFSNLLYNDISENESLGDTNIQEVGLLVEAAAPRSNLDGT